MSNSDTIFALLGTGTGAGSPRNALASLTALGTAETLLTMGADSGTNVTAFLPFPGATGIFGSFSPADVNANAAVLLDNTGGKTSSQRGTSRPYFNTASFDGRAFRIRIMGRFVTSAGSNTLTINVYQNTVANGPVTGSGNKIGSVAIGGAAIGAISGNFIVEVAGEWDSVSGKMQGAEQWGAAGGFYAARAVGQSTPFAVAAPLSNSLMFATATFAAGAANAITPVEFAFEDC